ncbi:hypothetical protein MTR_7g037570 [Medicago truncatula]|uniref:DUF4283 domain protein n=1 Tax=Medicago truncatula TaxID=3880 RepID=A2Q2G2_MEDTR|nr:hypothetical protein MtrDRAFT_AC150800g45v2 [Medicago truncatula]AES78645.2 hypothetical protein MTR_7g037570 [Medicago truncatula]
MSTFNIPWKCLDFDLEPTKTPIQQPKPQKPFGEAVSNICDIPQSQLPQAVIKGDDYVIQIPEDEYSAGMDACKFNLHGRVIWPKGSTPLIVVALKAKLTSLWKNLL